MLKKNSIWLHIAAWVFLMSINMLFVDTANLKTHFLKVSLPMWGAYMTIFYITYLVLVPKLLLKRRIVMFVVGSLLTISSIYVVIKTHFNSIRINEMTALVEEYKKGTKEFRPEEFPVHLLPKRGPRGTKPTVADFNEVLSDMRAAKFTWRSYDPMRRYGQSMTYSLLIVFAAAMIIRFIQHWKTDAERRQRLEQERVSSELEYLKGQINPHFLFNALNSIYSLTLPAAEAAGDAIVKLSSILRYMLYETDHEKVLLSDEIEVCENYIALQRLRLTDKTTVSFTVNGSVEGYMIEPLFMIPLIENAFKYGVDSSQESFIDINIAVNEKKLIFEEHNRVALKKVSDDASGIGIRNIKRRLELLYPGAYTFENSIEGDMYSVKLIFPIDRGEKK